MEVVVKIILIAIIAALILSGPIGDRRRRSQLSKIARKLQFSFDAEGCHDLGMLRYAPIFGAGHHRTLTNCMRGLRNQAAITIFDFQYTTGITHMTRVQTYQTVAAVRQSGRSLPVFRVSPKSLRDKVAEVFGQKTIELDNHSFLSKYSLRGLNEEGIRALFTDNVIAFFEGKSDLYVEAVDEWILVYRRYVLVAPEEIESFMQCGLQAASLFP